MLKALRNAAIVTVTGTLAVLIIGEHSGQYHDVSVQIQGAGYALVVSSILGAIVGIKTYFS